MSSDIKKDTDTVHGNFGDIRSLTSATFILLKSALWLWQLPQSRAEQSSVIEPGLVLVSENYHHHTTPTHVILQYRAILYILPQSTAEQSSVV